MPFRFGDIWRRFSAIGNWRLPGEPAFAKSRAFELLSRDLRRYVLEEVAGRSFLIAGHRGAGKTSTVVHAVRQLRRELITASVDPGSIPTGRRGRLQRPMMVKLVGEAILAAPPRQKEVEQAEAQGDADEKKDGSAGAGDDAAAKNGKAGGDAGEANDPVGNALVHITTALYRALAVEMSEAFTVHCLDGDERDRADRLELAAQLALELDGTPEPAMLRAYWARIGRLESGILWPRESDTAIEQSGIRDQGLKEVIAITTAAQAFQVCSGAVTYKIGSERSDKTESKTESGLDVKELVNRLGALGAGALAGSVVGIGAGAAEGVGIGLLVWLASSLTLKWTGSRERKSSRTLNYQFIQDRSIQTLDRDLPLVIDRIRQAGLAPVFVIDELDKLKKPGEEIAKIINRLKHLVADYGFFCFLANRDYFDGIQRTVADQAYPTEHTYFSERVLVLSRAEDLYDYLLGLLAEVPEEGAGALQAAVFALVVMFRSKLNFSDVAREVSALTGSGDELICTDEELQAPGRYRLAATIQIAIGRVLAAKDVKERMELDSGFAQLAVDALYYIPRKWESGTDTRADIRPRPLRDELLERMSAAKAPVPDPLPDDFPGPGEECAIGQSDLREICGMVERLAFYLSDFGALQAELQGEADRATTPADEARFRRLADIVMSERRGLMVVDEPDEPKVYCFILDELARPISPAPLPKPAPPPPVPAPKAPPPPPATKTRRRGPGARSDGGKSLPAAAAAQEGVAPPPPVETKPPSAPPPPPAPDQQLDQLAALFDAIDLLLSTFELDVEDLVLAGLLPSTISKSLLVGGRGDLAMARANPTHSEAKDKATNAYLALFQALNDRGNEVAQALVLLATARHESGKKEPAPRIFSRLTRHFEASGPFVIPSPLRSPEEWVNLSGKADSIRAFVSQYKKWHKLLAKSPVWMPEEFTDIALWEPWREEVEKFLLQNQTSAPVNVSRDTIVTAAADVPPGNLFRLRLSRMDSGDWSRVALAAVPHPGRIIPTPVWPLFAGLAALKFNSNFLAQLYNGARSELSARTSEDQVLVDGILGLSSFAQPPLLAVLPDQPSRQFVTISPNQPILVVGASEFQSWLPALNWLAERNAFLGAVNEIDRESKGSAAELQLSGKLSELLWVKTSRKPPPNEKAANAGDVVYNVETPEDFLRAFRQQQMRSTAKS